MNKYKFETLAIHAGENPDPNSNAIRHPIHMSNTFKLPKFGIKLFDALMMESDNSPFVYTRWGNPTLRDLEERLLALEEAEAAVVTASGMAAISALVFKFLQKGDHLIASEVCYAGTVELFGQYLPRYGVEVSLVDTCDLEQVRAAVQKNTKMIFLETPANPILSISDISEIVKIAQESNVLVAVDSTWSGPTIQRPLKFGADFVIYSLTKYLSGHGDALGGAVLGKKKLIQRIRKEMLVHLGGALSPFNAWLIMRGLMTLSLRMKQHCQNALLVAQFLENHPKVSRVIYPGLESHPQHELATQQMLDFGGMLTFSLKGGLGATITLAEKVRLFSYATSLGDAHSLLFYYPTDLYINAMPFYTDKQKQRIRKWTGDGILRASIGLESVDDLIADLDKALRARTFNGLIGPLAYQFLKKS